MFCFCFRFFSYKMFHFSNPYKIRQNQRTSLPSDWLAQNPTFSMYIKSSQSNQSFPYLPLINAADEYRPKLQYPLPLNAVQAVSLHNLATNYESDDKSPTLSAGFILDNPIQPRYKYARLHHSTNLIDAIPCSSAYKKIRSSSETLSRGFVKNQMSFSGEEIDKVNVNEIGWKIPMKISHGNSRQKIEALKARKSIPMPLKIIKSSVPVHSRSAMSIPNQRSLEEQFSAKSNHLLPQIQPLLNRKSIRNTFLKSRSFNSFENQSHVTGYHFDGFASSCKSVQTQVETELLRSSPIPTNRGVLSLDIVKSFDDDDLRKIIDSNTDSGVLDTSDTSVERSNRSRRKLPNKNNISNRANTLKLPETRRVSTSPSLTPDNQQTNKNLLTVEKSPEIARRLSRELSPIHSPRKETVAQQEACHDSDTGQMPKKVEEIVETKETNDAKESSSAAASADVVENIEESEAIQHENKPKFKQFFDFDTPQSETNNRERLNSDSKPRVRRFRKLSHRNSERRKKEKDQLSDQKTGDKEKPKFQNVFKKISSFPEDDDFETENQSGETGSDDVFDPPVFEKIAQRAPQRRSSSLEDLSLFQAKKLLEKNLERGRSSVSINDKPEYFEYSTKPLGHGANNRSSNSYPSIANHALNSTQSNNPNGIASLKMSPKRGLLKKPSSGVVNDVPSNSSEYDVRDRGGGSTSVNNRGTSGQPSLSSNNRESYRDRNDRGDRVPSRSLSDRDPREQDSFNRSLSTTEGTPDDKIGWFHFGNT